MTEDEKRALLSMVSRLVELVGNCEALLQRIDDSLARCIVPDASQLSELIADADRIIRTRDNPDATILEVVPEGSETP